MPRNQALTRRRPNQTSILPPEIENKNIGRELEKQISTGNNNILHRQRNEKYPKENVPVATTLKSLLMHLTMETHKTNVRAKPPKINHCQDVRNN